MDRWIGKVAIVTGASVGIGAAITENLLNYGITVVGVARDEEKLSILEQRLQKTNGKFYPKRADIRKDQEILDIFEWTKTNLGPVHILINNAGVLKQKGLLDGDTEDWKETLETNILGLCVATREVIKNMRENNVEGHIVHIGGLVVNDRLPNVNVCIASKVAVNTLTETVRRELNAINSKIKVTCINPGGVRSSSTPNATWLDHCKTAALLEPKHIADAVIYVLSTPPDVLVQDMSVRPIGELI